jgi:hypothetical protein
MLANDKIAMSREGPGARRAEVELRFESPFDADRYGGTPA